jgi:hypothetical protein
MTVGQVSNLQMALGPKSVGGTWACFKVLWIQLIHEGSLYHVPANLLLLQMLGEIGWSSCSWQFFLALSNICKRYKSLPLDLSTREVLNLGKSPNIRLGRKGLPGINTKACFTPPVLSVRFI